MRFLAAVLVTGGFAGLLDKVVEGDGLRLGRGEHLFDGLFTVMVQQELLCVEGSPPAVEQFAAGGIATGLAAVLEMYLVPQHGAVPLSAVVFGYGTHDHRM